MPRRSLSPELKQALSTLSIREKEKLIFRLLPKDDKLVERLEFELLEEGLTQEERRRELSVSIEKSLSELASAYSLSPGLILYTLRAASGRINRHLFVTKDKYGEIALNLQLLTQTLSHFGDRLPEFYSRKARNLNTYLIKRTIKVLNLLKKLHEDYQLDFQEELRKLGAQLQQQEAFRALARELQLDLHALADGGP